MIFCAGFGAALLGTMGGGGAGFIAIYALLIVGLPLNATVATFRLGDLGFYPATFYNFTRAGLMKKRLIVPLLFLEVIGGVIGTVLIIHLPDGVLKYLLTVILVPLLVFMLRKGEVKPGKASNWWQPVYFFGAVSASALQAGSFIEMFALMDLRKTPALEAAANRFVATAVSEVLSICMFFSLSKLIDIRLGLLLVAGNLFGAYFGSKIAIKGGNKLVRYVLLCLMAATILTVWLKKS